MNQIKKYRGQQESVLQGKLLEAWFSYIRTILLSYIGISNLWSIFFVNAVFYFSINMILIILIWFRSK